MNDKPNFKKSTDSKSVPDTREQKMYCLKSINVPGHYLHHKLKFKSGEMKSTDLVLKRGIKGAVLLDENNCNIVLANRPGFVKSEVNIRKNG